MQYAKIPYVDKEVSQIFYGVASDIFIDGEDGSELLDSILDLGINTLDMARQYGKAEWSVGNWLEKTGKRDQVVLLSKCAHPLADGTKRVSEREIRKDFELTSQDLRTDFIDIYLLHRDDPEVEVGEIVELLNAMHAEGKIGAFGGSNWTYQRIEAANEYSYKHNLIPFSVSSPNYGLAEQVQDLWGGGCITIAGPEHKVDREWYEKNQMPVVAYSSLGRGLFSGKLNHSNIDQAAQILDEFAMKGYGYPNNFERLKRCEELANEKGKSISQIALAYIFAGKINTFAVIGTRNANRMKENIEALDIQLTDNECKYLNLED